jgi:hypothetical protein
MKKVHSDDRDSIQDRIRPRNPPRRIRQGLLRHGAERSRAVLGAEALELVDRVREICVEQSPISHFYEFGTAKVPSRKPGTVTKAGLLLRGKV